MLYANPHKALFICDWKSAVWKKRPLAAVASFPEMAYLCSDTKVLLLMIVYHGSPYLVSVPMFGEGNPHNDYGLGFYCTEDLELAKEWAMKISPKLKELGFNTNFAPVADLGSFKDRHYSNNPKIAADFVEQAAIGYEESGMLYSLKHFPGIGRGKTDTHKDTVVVDATLEQLNDADVAPFVRVINRNTNDKQMIMVSHVVYSKVSGQIPASLSPEIMTKLLRERLGYKGIIITDDMGMGAVSRHYKPGEAAVASVMAGADVVMSCHIYENQKETAEALLSAVRSGKISEERINESLRRIIRAKLNLAAPRMGLIIKRSLDE